MVLELAFEQSAGRDAPGRAALLRIGLKFLHRHRLHGRRVTKPALCQFDDLLGDQFGYRVSAAGQAQRVARVEKRHTHRFDQFRIERLPAKKGCDWHDGSLRRYLSNERFERIARCLINRREIGQPFAKLVAARQRQPVPFQIQVVLFNSRIGLRCRFPRAVFCVFVALTNLFAHILKHCGLIDCPAELRPQLTLRATEVRGNPTKSN